MKQILTIFVTIFLLSCGPWKPDYVDETGREYSIGRRCVKSHIETKYEYHWGYNSWKGKYEWHWGNNSKNVCDSSVLDTTEINIEQKYYAKNK